MLCIEYETKTDSQSYEISARDVERLWVLSCSSSYLAVMCSFSMSGSADRSSKITKINKPESINSSYIFPMNANRDENSLHRELNKGFCSKL